MGLERVVTARLVMSIFLSWQAVSPTIRYVGQLVQFEQIVCEVAVHGDDA